MNAQEISKILSAIAATYQNFQAAEMTPEIWHIVLGEYSYEECYQATIRFLKSGSQFAPAPGQIAELVREAMAKRARATEVKEFPRLPGQIARAALNEHQKKLLEDLKLKRKPDD